MAKHKRPAQAALALEGALEQVGLGTVLAIFDMEKRSGVLTLRNRRRELGQVQLREGRAVSACLFGDRATRGRAALYRLLDWRNGSFGFRPGFVDAVDELNGSTTQLLLDAARQLDEHGSRWEASEKIALPATIDVR